MTHPESVNVYQRGTNVDFRLSTLTLGGSGIEEVQPGAWIERFNHNVLDTPILDPFPGIVFAPNYNPPTAFFNAVHMSLIPKGPHRGKVIVWNLELVIGAVSTIDGGAPWSFQAWCIVDPDPNASPRFRNYLLPIGPASDYGGQASWSNLFCAGHTWDEDGNLVLAGGSEIITAVDPLLDQTKADRRTWRWNPAQPGGWEGGSLVSTITQATPQAHYADSGSWSRGPNLELRRWYPTVMPYPNVTRTAGKTHMLVFGGARLEPLAYRSYNSYEALICDAAPSLAGGSGLVQDSVGGVVDYDGPSQDPTNAGETLFSDGLYFYPRTYVLADGSITFAGMAHRSSTLASHDTAPGVWTYLRGYDEVPGTWLGDRYYGSAVRLPNTDGNPDRLMRISGGMYEYIFPGSGGLIDTPSCETLDGNSATAQWTPGASMSRARYDLNTVLLPDATIFAFGGVDVREDLVIPLEGAGDWTTDKMLNPIHIAEHATHGVSDLNAAMSQLLGNLKETYSWDIDPNVAAQDDIVGFYEYLRIPEVLRADRSAWDVLDYAPHIAWRDYHATGLLLPDGRVLTGGGNFRHIPRASLPNGYAWDYEVFAPRYLRPTQDPAVTYTRPTNVVVTGGTFNADPEVDCIELTNGGSYACEIDSIPGETLTKVVLMAPGSVTHHACYNQRYYEVSSAAVTASKRTFTLPANVYELPRGFYMLFAVSSQDVPSVATWIKVV